jgi:hypothetical protein
MTTQELRTYGRRFGYAPSTITGWVQQDGPPAPVLAMLSRIKQLEIQLGAHDWRLACESLE